MKVWGVQVCVCVCNDGVVDVPCIVLERVLL